MTKAQLWSGRIISGLVIIFLVFDAVVKIVFLRDMPEASQQLGWSTEMATPLGVLLAVCTLLYAFPRTAFLGAILLTGYLGGAVATHMRIASPVFSHVLFGVYLGMAIWGGLYLRSPVLRDLMPWHRGGNRQAA